MRAGGCYAILLTGPTFFRASASDWSEPCVCFRLVGTVRLLPTGRNRASASDWSEPCVCFRLGGWVGIEGAEGRYHQVGSREWPEPTGWL